MWLNDFLAVSLIKPVKDGQCPLRFGMCRHGAEPNFRVMCSGRRRAQFLHQLVEADATVSRQLLQASAAIIWQTKSHHGHRNRSSISDGVTTLRLGHWS